MWRALAVAVAASVGGVAVTSSVKNLLPVDTILLLLLLVVVVVLVVRLWGRSGVA